MVLTAESYCDEAHRSLKKIPGLDALRGVAIIMVMMIHASQVFSGSDFLKSLFAVGDKGVQLFFIVSGFTLWISLITSKFSLMRYVSARFFRIYPLYLIFCLFYAIYLFGKSWYWCPGGVGYFEIFSNIALLHGLFPMAANSLVPGGWSIGTEVAFYSLLPVALLIKWTRMRFTILFVVSLSIALASILYSQKQYSNGNYILGAYFGTFSILVNLTCFVLGAGLGSMYIRDNNYFPTNLMGYCIALLSTIFLIVSQLYISSPFLVIFQIGCLGVLTFSLSKNRMSSPFARLIVRLGTVSYSVYFVHFIVLKILSKCFIGLDDLLIQLVFCFALVTFSLGVSIVTHRFIESPFIRIGKAINL